MCVCIYICMYIYVCIYIRLWAHKNLQRLKKVSEELEQKEI
jgi:hypothetical protein